MEHSIVKPLDAYEEQYNIRCAGAVEASKMRRRILEKRQKAIEDQVAKGKADAEELDKIAQEITDFEEVRPFSCMWMTSPQKSWCRSWQPTTGGRHWSPARAASLTPLPESIPKNVNIDVMLKGYSGDPIRVDRIGRRRARASWILPLTVLLMAQPNVLSEVMRKHHLPWAGAYGQVPLQHASVLCGDKEL